MDSPKLNIEEVPEELREFLVPYDPYEYKNDMEA